MKLLHTRLLFNTLLLLVALPVHALTLEVAADQKVIFVLHPNSESPAKAFRENDPQLFNEAYNPDDSQLVVEVTTHANEPAAIEIRAPRPMRNKAAFDRLPESERNRISNVMSFGGQIVGLYHYADKRKFVPTEYGRVRRITPLRNRLLLLTETGKVLLYDITGALDQMRVGLYEIKAPPALRAELAEQDVVGAYFGRQLDLVVLTLNGNSFGSKVWAFDGTDASNVHTRLFFNRLRPDVPLFGADGPKAWDPYLNLEFESAPLIGDRAPVQLSLPKLEIQ